MLRYKREYSHRYMRKYSEARRASSFSSRLAALAYSLPAFLRLMLRVHPAHILNLRLTALLLSLLQVNGLRHRLSSRALSRQHRRLTTMVHSLPCLTHAAACASADTAHGRSPLYPCFSAPALNVEATAVAELAPDAVRDYPACRTPERVDTGQFPASG